MIPRFFQSATSQRVAVASVVSVTTMLMHACLQQEEETSPVGTNRPFLRTENNRIRLHTQVSDWFNVKSLLNQVSPAYCDASDPGAESPYEKNTGGVQRAKTDYSKLAERQDDDKTTFYGQCLLRQLYRPRLPYPAWDYDWDHRETSATSQEAMSSGKGFAESKRLGKTRHLILVRHGQYDERYKDDRRRKLTPLGRHQAELTGQRLALIARGGLGMMKREFAGPCHFKCIHSSDMERAKETARIIASHLPHVELKEPDTMLNEALPAPMIPIRPDIRAVREIDANHSRIEAAFQKYVHRSDPEDEAKTDEGSVDQTKEESVEHDDDESGEQHQPPQGPGSTSYSSSYHSEHVDHEHEFEVIVGHGNIIRYFFCRALQLPPEAWLRISTFNCSITYLIIYPNGYVSCRMLGDVGHLGYDSTTFSGSHGYNW
eukprot:CAMPEP_0172448912 /NCGR_PEP_ID=MMETSP1065-20121228/7799_1 /TAXON_ID=265537 /ORGANISM="Amphiprora paludosa, Strain CCMP125" /LENGTH=430 /DNA_ID=CAMNT_0013200505 /DNA_START=9 /DNA_END=1301 /DNA_ORIENTATION=-